jgi:phosphohistidine phosphatase
VATLELYLIRHGLAADRGAAYPDDSLRPLTGRGLSATRRSGKALNALGVGIDVILTSPLVRARQTADTLAATLAAAPAVVSCDALAPAGMPAAVVQEVRRARKTRVALVGHEPNIGELAARLLGTSIPVPFKKGAICRLDFEVLPPKGMGVLRWFLPPKVLRRLGA